MATKAKKKTAIVTGGTGNLGSRTTANLLKQGFTVRIIDLPDTKPAEDLQKYLGDSNLTFELKNVLDISPDDPIFHDVDYIFHCAGIADHRYALQTPEPYLEANVMSLVRVLEAARINGIQKFIYPSSAAVYGVAEWPTREDHPLNPVNPYGLSKLMGELAVQHWHKIFNVPTITFRIFLSYGQNTNGVGIIAHFFRNRLAGKPLTITGDGTQRRDFIFIDDVVDAFISAAKSDKSGGIYNLGSGATATINQIAELIGGDIEYIPKNPNEPEAIWADIAKIKEEIGWQPKIDLEEGISSIKKTINFQDSSTIK